MREQHTICQPAGTITFEPDITPRTDELQKIAQFRIPAHNMLEASFSAK